MQITGKSPVPIFFGLFSLLSSTCMREHIKQKRKKSPLTNEAREGTFWINCFFCSSPFGSVQKCAYSAVYLNSPFKVVNISIMRASPNSLEFPGGPWRSLEVLGGPWRSLEVPGSHWRSLEVPGGPWSILEHPGASWRILENPV